MKNPFLKLLTWILAFSSVSSAAWSAELTVPLTSEQVACNAAQLDRLLARAEIKARRFSDIPKTLFVTYSNSAGFFEGLAMSNQFSRYLNEPNGFPPPSEYHLGFNLNPDIRTLLLNPERPPLGQVGLNREQSTSTLVPPSAMVEMTLTLDPSTTGNPDPDLLVINNYEVPASGAPYNGFLANSTKPGRGLSQDKLLTSCHGLFSEQDRRIFALLQRIVKVRGELSGEFQGIFADAEVSIFRGEPEKTYRLNVYFADLEGTPKGHLALALEIEWLTDGRLGGGVLRVLPNCADSLACTTTSLKTEINVVAPSLPVEEKWDEARPESRRLVFDPTQPLPSPVAVDFEALLAGTTWNFPVP